MFTKGTQTEDADMVFDADATLMEIVPLDVSGDTKEEPKE